MQKKFLILGLVFSAISKLLQWYYKSIWGDIIILPAAVMFVLAILLYWPRYLSYLKQSKTKNKAKLFALFCCLSVLSFQIFTMLSFGKKMLMGYIFIFPLLLFICFSIYFWNHLSKTE